MPRRRSAQATTFHDLAAPQAMKKSIKVMKAVTIKRRARSDRKPGIKEKPKKTSQANKKLPRAAEGPATTYFRERFLKINNKPKERQEESNREVVPTTCEHRMWEMGKEMMALRADYIRGLGTLQAQIDQGNADQPRDHAASYAQGRLDEWNTWKMWAALPETVRPPMPVEPCRIVYPS